MIKTKQLECVECHCLFEFTEKDQLFYEEMGFTPPKRCRDCRQRKKAEMERREKNKSDK